MRRSISLLVGIGMVGFLAGCDGSSSSQDSSAAAVDSAACEDVQAQIETIETAIKGARETAWKHQDELEALRGQLEKLGCAD